MKKKKAKSKKLQSLSKLAATSARLERNLRKEAQESVKPALHEAFMDLKRAIPTLVSVRWEQYTPYFCDGDPCVFGIGLVYGNFGTDDGYEEDGWVEIDAIYDEVVSALPNKAQNLLVAFSGHINAIEDSLEIAFGDHATITLTEDDIEVEENTDHD